MSIEDSIIAFWTLCAVVGGPIFGAAGHLWRTGRPSFRGLGMAVLAGAFIAEGLWVYVHQLQRFTTAVLRLGIGALLVVGLSRTLGALRWLVITVPAGSPAMRS